jgi:putative transposase
VHGVQIAPRTYYAWRGRGPSRRALWEITVTELLAGFYEPDGRGRRRPESLYGAVKMWAHLHRQGIPVARCTVERLMRAHGWRGVRRDRRVRTTIAGAGAARAADLVDRRFRASAPNALFVADFTYVPVTAGGFVYTAFVIDAYAGAIVGWQVAGKPDADMVGRALADALETRRRQGHPVTAGAVHHSDAGTQGGFNWSSQHLDLEVCRWDDGLVGLRRRRGGRGCGRRVGRRWRGGSIVSGSGRRSLVASQARAPVLRPACRRRSGHAGSASVAACHRQTSRHTRAASCRSASGRR